MAQENEIGVKITVKGGEEAKREIKAITGSLNNEAKLVDRAAQQRQADAVRASGGGAAAAGGAGGAAVAGGASGGVASGVFFGALGAQFASAAFSAIGSSIAQSFDPNLTQFEKEFAKLEAIRGVPVVGEIAAAQIRAANQVELGSIQGANRLVNNQIGAAAQAIGLANPEANNEELARILEEQLGNLIDELVKLQLPGERAQEVASQLVVRRLDEALGGARPSDPTPGAVAEKTIATLETSIGGIAGLIQTISGDLKSAQQTFEGIRGALDRLTGIFGGSR